jgi:glycosyltransferase involved in cell wall biosynthesis
MEKTMESLNILLANYRYFIGGGSERYLFNATELFKEKGHSVIPFSAKHPRNRPSEFSDYFLSSLSDDEDAVLFRQFKLRPKTVIKLIDRSFYSVEAKRQIKRLLSRYNVDIAYVLHFLRWISPSILTEFSRNNIPIIVRISDFEYICHGTHLLRDGEICDICVEGNLLPSVKHKCIQNSFLLSLAHYLAMSLYKLMRVFEKIDAFIFPSLFALEQMARAGFSRSKMYHVPTFVDTQKISPNFVPGGYILYFGRISSEKGIDVLLDAYQKYIGRNSVPCMPLHIIQTGRIDAERLMERVRSERMKNVRVFGGLSKEEFASHIEQAAFTVVPSLFYENLPNVVLESYAFGKAVVGSRRGSILEVIQDGETGLLFEAGDSDDLADKLDWLASHADERLRMAQKARKAAEDQYNKELHYKRLMDIFQKYI